MQLESCAMLDTAEGGLSQDVCATVLIVLGDIVEDLERCSACNPSKWQVEQIAL